MINKQAISYMDSIMGNYEASKIKDWTNPMYRQVTMWLSDKDIIALKMGIEALKHTDNHAYWLEREEPICEDDVDVFYMCSDCHETFDYAPNYCPHCGAKMDGGAAGE